MELGPVGVWTFALGSVDAAQLGHVLGELEDLGYGTAWFPGGRGEASFDQAQALLGSSRRLTVATGIVNIWAIDGPTAATRARSLWAKHGERFVLGLGVSHPEFINRVAPGRYERPLAAMGEFLDDLDATPSGVGGGDGAAGAASGAGARGDGTGPRVLAALGPAMLRLSAERSAGAHPYFVPVEHTADARSVLGPHPVLAPEQAVVLSSDATVARQAARRYMILYLQLSNYVNNLRRFGFTDDDVAGPSDRLVDAIVAWGDEQAIAARVRAHHDAGADHVCIQVLPVDDAAAPTFPMDELRRLAPALAPGC